MKKLKLTCYSNNHDEIRTLAEFEDSPEKDALKSSAQAKAIDYIHDLLFAIKRFSLLSELNQIQVECNREDKGLFFPDKTTMPLCIINLVLKQHGLKIEEGK